MIDKIKNTLAAAASLSALLYAAGYIAEKAHDKLLGISGVEGPMDHYLVVGGQFFISTLFALYSSVLSPHVYVFVIFLILSFIIISREKAKGGKRKRGSSPFYYVFIFFSIIFLLYAVRHFTSPFIFTDFLLPGGDAMSGFNVSRAISELETWIQNENPKNTRKLALFYSDLLFGASFSALLLWSMVQRWRRLSPPASAPPSNDGKAGLRKRLKGLYARLAPHLARYCHGFLLGLLAMITVVLILSVPMDYGILLKSNRFPEVKIHLKKEKVKDETTGKVVERARDLLDGEVAAEGRTVWLIRENDSRAMLYVQYYRKGAEENESRLFKIKKEIIEKTEVLKNSSIFQVNLGGGGK